MTDFSFPAHKFKCDLVVPDDLKMTCGGFVEFVLYLFGYLIKIRCGADGLAQNTSSSDKHTFYTGTSSHHPEIWIT